MINNKILLTISTVLTLLSLHGCGSSSGSGSAQVASSNSISGIIARGRAVNNKTVFLLDSNLNELTTSKTDTSGNYTLVLPDDQTSFFVKSEELMSFVESKSDNSNLVVHLNPITTFATNEVLKLPLGQRTKASFESKGQEVVNKVLGSNTSFESFNNDLSFVAATDVSNTEPSVADMILDGLQEKAETKNLSQLELIQEYKYSTNACDQNGLLSDDIFGTSLLANISKNKVPASQIQQAIHSKTSQSISYSSDNAVVRIFSKFSKRFSDDIPINIKQIALTAFKKSIYKVIQDELSNQNVCSLSELNPNALTNLVSNLEGLLSENIVNISKRLSMSDIGQQAKDLVLLNAVIQSSNIASQLNISSPLSDTVMTVGKNLSSDILTQSETVLNQQLSNTPNDFTSVLNSSAVKNLAGFTKNKRSELVKNPIVKDSVKSKIPETSSLLQIDVKNLSSDSSQSRPELTAKKVELSFSKVSNRRVSGSVNISRASIEDDFDTYNLYWGASPTIKLSNHPVIAKIDKTSDSLIYNLTGVIIPLRAKYILVHTEKNLQTSRAIAFDKILKLANSHKLHLVPTSIHNSPSTSVQVITLNTPHSTIQVN
ncbi:MAG: hypothetical protein KC646_00635 [Candidatus Cloacimonetes bacterium]|nr:hypothetical protein [Candidatus Cloacimonadota bacterium]